MHLFQCLHLPHSATLQPPLEAGAMQERTLEAVGYTRLFGSALTWQVV
jgi:hypothetical protein